MNPYTTHLNRLEFMVTLACTGRCKHCSEGKHPAAGAFIDGDTAAKAVRDLCTRYDIQSVMTFGGEPLLYPDAVCKIHHAAREAQIPQRQMITNGFFSRDPDQIRQTAFHLARSGVNDVLLSVDAFHQETIPLEPVKLFAQAVQEADLSIRTHPAWLVSPADQNPYNKRTAGILAEFARMGIPESEGNVIFASGNARKYLGEYFDPNEESVSPYREDPEDVRAVCVSPSGDVLGGNIHQDDILEIIERYRPVKTGK